MLIFHMNVSLPWRANNTHMFIWKCPPAAMTSEPHSLWQNLANKCLYVHGLFAREKFVFILATEGRKNKKNILLCPHSSHLSGSLELSDMFLLYKMLMLTKVLIKKISCISSNIKMYTKYFFKLWWPFMSMQKFSIFI